MRLLLIRSLAAYALLFALLPASAFAQANAVLERFQTDGTALPPTGAALVDEATAPEVNPAGLALLDRPQLIYLHERNLRQDRVVDSFHVGTGLFGYGGLGLALQFVRPKGLPSYRKTTLSLAAGGGFASLGVNFNNFGSDDAALDALTSWDAGLALRPWRYLSIAASVRDFDGPTLSYARALPPGAPTPPGFEPKRLPRRYDVGLGIRPGTDRVQLSGDWLVDDLAGVDASRFSFAAQVEPLEGLVLSGGLAFGLKGNDELVGQVALTLNTPYVGASWWGGAGDDIGGRWDQGVQLRLSADRYRTLPFARDRVVVLDPSSLMSKSQGVLASLIAPSSREPYLETLGLLERVRTSKETAGVLLKVGKLPDIGHARVEELRQALVALRASGKHVWAVWMDGGDDEYLLASAAEKIWAVPQSTLAINGYSSTQTFLAGTLQKLGVGVDVARVGQYKTATDSFTRQDMSPEEREMLGAWLDQVYGSTMATIAGARGLSEESLAKVVGQGILPARMAKDAGLVDELIYPDELQGLLEKGHGKSLDVVGELPAQQSWPRRWGVRPKNRDRERRRAHLRRQDARGSLRAASHRRGRVDLERAREGGPGPDGQGDRPARGLHRRQRRGERPRLAGGDQDQRVQAGGRLHGRLRRQRRLLHRHGRPAHLRRALDAHRVHRRLCPQARPRRPAREAGDPPRDPAAGRPLRPLLHHSRLDRGRAEGGAGLRRRVLRPVHHQGRRVAEDGEGPGGQPGPRARLQRAGGTAGGAGRRDRRAAGRHRLGQGAGGAQGGRGRRRGRPRRRRPDGPQARHREPGHAAARPRAGRRRGERRNVARAAAGAAGDAALPGHGEVGALRRTAMTLGSPHSSWLPSFSQKLVS
ncbi:MAG: S49 family peptidase [Myxococcales bacterium]